MLMSTSSPSVEPQVSEYNTDTSGRGFLKKQKTPGKPLPPQSSFPKTVKITPGTMTLPPFPEMRKMRVFDDSKGDAVQFIEVTDGVVQEALVTEEFVENYVVHDFRRESERGTTVLGESTKLL
jgi:hypothetical protein